MKRSKSSQKVLLLCALFISAGFVLGLIFSNNLLPKSLIPWFPDASSIKLPAFLKGLQPQTNQAPASTDTANQVLPEAAETTPIVTTIATSQPSKLPIPSDEKPTDSDAELTPTNLPLKLPGAAIVTVRRDALINQLETKNAKFPTFAVYQKLAEHHIELGNNAEAARIFRAQAALYRQKGLADAAQIMDERAAQNETVTRIFAARADAPAGFSGAPLEPKRGAYIGAFIDRDDALRVPFNGDNYQTHRFPSEFESRVGRRLSSVFTYVKWGNFPRKWLQMCKEQGVIPQIAWEPDNLNDVRDDAYLRDCERFLSELDWPVWIRFAGEMNGDWTPYHGNPNLYKEKFRLVHNALHRGQARVATVWCVNAIPLGNIDQCYPGDDACDWVGVNFYSAPFADNDRSREAFRQSPLSLLDPIYRKYSARKPIAICEYAASHQAKLDMKMRPDFAIEKMSLLYGALPLLYPRVKMISWFDANNLVHAEPGRQLNNYRLTELLPIQNAFRDLTASPHYLKRFPPADNPTPSLRELKPNEPLKAGERVWLWVTSAATRPLVYLTINGKTVYGGRQYGKHVLDLPRGAGQAIIAVYDGSGRCVSRREIAVK